MIYSFKSLCKIFKGTGSVFKTTILIAAPCAGISSLLQCLFPNGSFQLLDNEKGVLRETTPWAGFSFLVGFLIVFRTSQAYSRFWEGCTGIYRMRAEWFDAVGSVVTFTKHSSSSPDDIMRFKELLVRLTSMLHAAALAELEAGDEEDTGELWAYSYDVIDPAGIDSGTLETIKDCDMRTELIFIWIQQVIVEHIKNGVLTIPPPILSRVFQELANGMVAFHDTMRISYLPFPYPYARACDAILILHWFLVPLVTSQWVTSAMWAAIFSFVQVFILWSLNLIAMEIDHPFGQDSNDIDGKRLQVELNKQLLLLVSTSVERTPSLSSRWSVKLSEAPLRKSKRRGSESECSWKDEFSDNSSDRKEANFRLRRPSTLGEMFHYVSETVASKFSSDSQRGSTRDNSTGSCIIGRDNSTGSCIGGYASQGQASSAGLQSQTMQSVTSYKMCEIGIGSCGPLAFRHQSSSKPDKLQLLLTEGAKADKCGTLVDVAREGARSICETIEEEERPREPPVLPDMHLWMAPSGDASFSCPKCRHLLSPRSEASDHCCCACRSIVDSTQIYFCERCSRVFCRSCAIGSDELGHNRVNIANAIHM